MTRVISFWRKNEREGEEHDYGTFHILLAYDVSAFLIYTCEYIFTFHIYTHTQTSVWLSTIALNLNDISNLL